MLRHHKNSFYIKNGGSDTKIVEKFTKNIPALECPREWIHFGGAFVIYRFKKSVSPVPNTKNLKIAGHVDIHVLQLPTKFQANIWRRKCYGNLKSS